MSGLTVLCTENTERPKYEPKNPEKYIDDERKYREDFKDLLGDASELGKECIKNSYVRPLGGVPNGH